jgi:nitroimidazol reductase NimA-like FMN-containing flavoprotein (pyridoxamine 5'-phosphate oxidase superfamily)
MLVQEIAKLESLKRLANMHLGRLACAQGAQPYVAPFYFVYDNNYLYSFSTVGRKIDWMRANPLVCVETDEIASSEEWVSIIIMGRYDELPDTPERRTERELGYALLQQKAHWWEPAYAKTVVHGAERPLVPIYFRIQIVEITGRRGEPDGGKETETTNQMACS